MTRRNIMFFGLNGIMFWQRNYFFVSRRSFVRRQWFRSKMMRRKMRRSLNSNRFIVYRLIHINHRCRRLIRNIKNLRLLRSNIGCARSRIYNRLRGVYCRLNRVYCRLRNRSVVIINILSRLIG